MQTPSAPEAHSSRNVVTELVSRYGEGAVIPLETFVEAALYLPEVGYYRRPTPRVGYREDRDFYTAESLGTVFRDLVLAAIEELLPEGLGRYRFVELGAEEGRGLFQACAHPFAAADARGYGPLGTLAGPHIVFSNELFDAQPFRRFQAVNGHWHEVGVRLSAQGLQSSLLERDEIDLPEDLPTPTQSGYVLDYPSGARRLAAEIVRHRWDGLFIAFDYGLDADALFHARPAGTARTYCRHRSGSDILVDPGTVDITHHICWDHLQDALTGAGFHSVQLHSQEGFFMRHSITAVDRIVRQAAKRGVHRDLQTLKELLHPENMGRKFQVLLGFRAENACHAPAEG